MARWLWLVLSALWFGCTAHGNEEPVRKSTSPLTQEYPVCGKTQSKTSGPPWAPCASLDTECQRGAWDPDDQCCHLVPRVDGTTCSSGQCNGLGKCEKPANPKDRDGDGTDDSKDAVIGKAGWIQAYGGEPSFWDDIYSEERRIELRIDDRPAAWIPADPPIDLSRVEIALGPKPKERRAVFLSAPVAWADVELDAGEVFEVCLPKPGTSPELPMPADCKAQHLQRLQCPARLEDGTDCAFEAGILRLHAPKLWLAWLPIDGKSDDIRLLDLPFFIPIEPCWYCDDFPGDFPPPILHLETCNGADDNDDGRVDEDGTRLCDDHVPCTRDECHGKDGCVHLPRDSGAFCRSAADCMEVRCNVPFSAGPDQEATTEPDMNGCYRLLKHDFCSDTWDGCACNGREKCDPVHSPRPPRSTTPWAETKGCMAETPPLELPCEQLNGDGNGCSIETCCEEWNPTECRIHRQIEARGADAVSAYQTVCDFPFGTHSADGTLFCPNDPVRLRCDTHPAPMARTATTATRATRTSATRRAVPAPTASCRTVNNPVAEASPTAVAARRRARSANAWSARALRTRAIRISVTIGPLPHGTCSGFQPACATNARIPAASPSPSPASATMASSAMEPRLAASRTSPASIPT